MNQTYLNTPAKSCLTCAHCVRESYGNLYNKCARYGFHFCTDAIKVCKMEQWSPEPPKPARRSLRQWLYDIFLG